MKIQEKSAGEGDDRVKKIILYLDTASDETVVVLFDGDNLLAEKNWNGYGDLSERLLMEIDLILSENNIKKTELSLIAVNDGPGSYTGLRIGVTCANFLAWSLGIALATGKIENGKLSFAELEKNHFVLPKYLREAHITAPKKK